MQEEYVAECVAVGYLPPIVETDSFDLDNDDADDDGDDDTAVALNDSSKKKLEILMSFDKHKAHTPTLDTYVIKTTPAPNNKNNVPIPQLKAINLDDPKFKTKDLKPKPTKSSKPKTNE